LSRRTKESELFSGLHEGKPGMENRSSTTLQPRPPQVRLSGASPSRSYDDIMLIAFPSLSAPSCLSWLVPFHSSLLSETQVPVEELVHESPRKVRRSWPDRRERLLEWRNALQPDHPLPSSFRHHRIRPILILSSARPYSFPPPSIEFLQPLQGQTSLTFLLPSRATSHRRSLFVRRARQACFRAPYEERRPVPERRC
jgi:hypothetical protein